MSKKISLSKKYVADILLVLIVIFLALSVFVIVELTREDGSYVVVTVNAEESFRCPLAESGEYIIGDGGNVLVVEGGEAYMKYADCPDGLCKNQGRISKTGERIVCLPNRVEVSVVGEGEEIIPVG